MVNIKSINIFNIYTDGIMLFFTITQHLNIISNLLCQINSKDTDSKCKRRTKSSISPVVPKMFLVFGGSN